MLIDPDFVADYGLDADIAPAATSVDADTWPTPPVLEVGGVPARVLYSVCAGTPVTVVDSPPGGGKTHAVVAIIAHLVNTLGLNVVLASPTGEQAIAVAHRLLEALHPSQIHFHLSDCDTSRLNPLLHRPKDRPAPTQSDGNAHGVAYVRTIASVALSSTWLMGVPEVLVIDEAYQATFSWGAAAARGVQQVILVGDPGQIGPVVTVNTSGWDGFRLAPHRRAPEAFLHHKHTRITIDKTYRIGPASVDVLSSLYDFPFVSARPDRHVALDQRPLAEIEQIAVPRATSPVDPALIDAVAQRVVRLTSGTYTDAAGTRALVPGDIAVLAALNAQVTAISAALGLLGLGEVKVGTADKLQGGQWVAAVSLDPTCSGQASGHALSLGRLAVMLSRHMAHLTWVHDGTWRDLLADDDPSRTVRERLLGG